MEASFMDNLQQATVQFPAFMMAVVFHEYAHGLAASRFGDTTARDQGRLTLNPVPHIDPVGTVLFPLINMVAGINWLIGWARPVPIDPTRFSHYRRGLFFVSFAGPAMNLFLGFLSAFAWASLVRWVSPEFALWEPFKAMAEAAVFLNFTLACFNLLPLPPLDGSKMIESFLSIRATLQFERLAQYSFFIFLALMMTGLFRYLTIPIVILARLAFFAAGSVIGVSPTDL